MDCLNCRNENRQQRCANAARKGHLKCLIWAREQRCPWDARTCADAAMNGRLETLIWARDHGCPWDTRTCTDATRNEHKDILKWIHKNGSPCDCMKEKKVYEMWNEWVKGEECNICLEKLDETTVKFYKCRHRYHKECMDMMLEMREKVGKKGCSICERAL